MPEGYFQPGGEDHIVLLLASQNALAGEQLAESDGMSSTWRPAPQRLMKTGSIGICCAEACGPEVFDLTGA